MKKQNVINILNSWKMLGENDTFVNHLVFKDNMLVAILKPITKYYNRIYENLPLLIGGWRRNNPSLSQSMFHITEENTKNWVEKLVINRKDRILFMIEYFNGHYYIPVGHIGFSSFDFKNNSAELDCVLRAVEVDVKDFMKCVVLKMIDIGKNILLLDDLYLSVDINNERAINLYTKCGFRKVKIIPLFRKEKENEVRWDPDDKRNMCDAERFSIKMKLEGR
jgi:RimJ/RimL family protein N-acetyltransferase